MHVVDDLKSNFTAVFVCFYSLFAVNIKISDNQLWYDLIISFGTGALYPWLIALKIAVVPA